MVTGIEPDARCAGLAASAARDLPGVEVRHSPFAPLPESSADLVTFVASPHHLPLAPTLAAARSTLRPGGRLVVVGLHRDTPADGGLSFVSVALDPLVGLLLHPRTTTGTPLGMTAPVKEPENTHQQLVTAPRTQLPGARVRRASFWRYPAVWSAPSATSSSSKPSSSSR